MANVSTLTASIPSYPTTAEVAANIQAALQQLKTLATNFNAGGLTQTMIEAIAIALGSDASTLPGSNVQGAYEILATASSTAFVATASGIFLDLKAADVGVTRKPATVSIAPLLFSSPIVAGVGGISIPAGTIVQAQSADPSAYPTLFQTIATSSIAQGQTTSPIILANAVNAGSAGNVPAGAINQVISGVTGLTVTNPSQSSGGTDQEGDDAPNGGLRFRTLQAIPNASQCTTTALEADAESYAGITSAKCIDLVLPDGVTPADGHAVVFCDDGSGDLGDPGNPNHASLVQFNLDLNTGKYKAAGATVVAVGSTLLATTVALSIDVAASFLLTGATTAQVAAAVQAAVFAYVQGSALGAPVVIASIIEAAKAVAGVSNVLVSTVLVNGSASDLQGTPSQVARCATLSAVTITVNATTPYS